MNSACFIYIIDIDHSNVLSNWFRILSSYKPSQTCLLNWTVRYLRDRHLFSLQNVCHFIHRRRLSVIITNSYVFVHMFRSTEVSIVKDWTKFDSDAERAVWKNFQLKHKDFIEAEVQVTNGATNKITRKTDGFLVDLAAPILNYIHDGSSPIHDIQFQVIYAVFITFSKLLNRMSAIITKFTLMGILCSGYRTYFLVYNIV